MPTEKWRKALSRRLVIIGAIVFFVASYVRFAQSQTNGTPDGLFDTGPECFRAGLARSRKPRGFLSPNRGLPKLPESSVAIYFRAGTDALVAVSHAVRFTRDLTYRVETVEAGETVDNRTSSKNAGFPSTR